MLGMTPLLKKYLLLAMADRAAFDQLAGEFNFDEVILWKGVPHAPGSEELVTAAAYQKMAFSDDPENPYIANIADIVFEDPWGQASHIELQAEVPGDGGSVYGTIWTGTLKDQEGNDKVYDLDDVTKFTLPIGALKLELK